MGDIADMIIGGALDEDGYYDAIKNTPLSKKTQCPECGKRVKRAGLGAHIKAKHNDITSIKCSCTGCDNIATHTWSGHPTCDDCGTRTTINKE